MNVKKKQILMEEVSIFNEGDRGVKGYEIYFQRKIEDTLKANGFSNKAWWDVTGHGESIFMKVWDCYKKEKEGESIMLLLQNYYDDLKVRTDAWIGERL